tara:strand:- start:601 stop:816 length:216 start_codon:yes stop_codon:yes gene_type:complete
LNAIKNKIMAQIKKILKIVSKIIGYLFFFNTFIIIYFGIKYQFQAVDQILLKVVANAALGFVFLYLGKSKK